MKDIIILYLDKFKKKFLVYKETELYDMKLPLEYVDDGRNMYLDDLKEKWEIKEVKSTKNELTIKFKLVLRKT